MSNVVRYYETEDGDVRRLVENRRTKKRSTGASKFDYEIETDRRWFTIEEYDDRRGWTTIDELGDYVDPSDAPHK